MCRYQELSITIANRLRERYNKKGKDFYFRSNQINKLVNEKSSTIIGTSIKKFLIPQGKVIMWSDRKHNRTFKTTFEAYDIQQMQENI